MKTKDNYLLGSKMWISVPEIRLFGKPFLRVAPLTAKKIKNNHLQNSMEYLKHIKGGRPSLDLPRNKQIKGSFTVNDYGKILIIANELGLKPGEYISQIALTGKIIDTFSPAQKEAVRKLIGMSNNLNQIAKLAHTSGFNLIVLELDELIEDIGILIEKGR